MIRAVLPPLMSNIRQHSGPFPFLSPSVPACRPLDPLGPIPYLCSRKQRTKEPQYHSHSSLYQSENIAPSSCDCACECASVPSPPRRLALESNHILRLFSNTVNERLAEAGDASVLASGSRSPHLLHARTQKRKTSQNFHQWTATGFRWQNHCFRFDSLCFLFSSASHFLGKPAALISDTHVSRNPRRL